MKITCIFLSLFLFSNLHNARAFLNVRKGDLYYNNDKVFLSGANIAWYNYARDFGSGAYSQVKARYEEAIDEISKAGGNAIRVWVHVDGQWSPKFDSNGFATGEDTKSLIDELGQLLNYAKQKNVLVILCLWNLAVKPDQMLHLYTQEDKLQSYLDKVLKPLVTAFKDNPALGAYDLINEPVGGLSQDVSDPNPCFDTKHLINSGANWSGANLKAKDVLRFINLHADAIKSADPKAVITIGESGERTATTVCSDCRDIYSDQCLLAAGGKPKGTIDFYQLHSYVWQGKYSDTCPFHKTAKDYNASKPILVGEFSSVCSESKDPAKNYRYIYDSGYAGGLSWQYNEGGDCADQKSTMNAGMSAIKDLTTNGKIHIEL